MKRPWLSALLNFFFMGAGYLYNGKRMIPGLLLTLGAFGLTYIEQIYAFGDGYTLMEHDSSAFMIVFISVFLANTGLAIDGYKEAKELNSNSSNA